MLKKDFLKLATPFSCTFCIIIIIIIIIYVFIFRSYPPGAADQKITAATERQSERDTKFEKDSLKKTKKGEKLTYNGSHNVGKN